MKASDLDRLRPLVTPAYVVAALLIVIPLADTLLAVLPPRVGDVSWRFGALGIGSQAIMTPLLGLLLLLLTGTLFEQRAPVRLVQILGWSAVVVILATIVLFILDAVQMRAAIRDEARGGFDKASLLALAKYIAGVVGAGIFAVSGRHVLKRTRQAAPADTDKGKIVFDAPAKA